MTSLRILYVTLGLTTAKFKHAKHERKVIYFLYEITHH